MFQVQAAPSKTICLPTLERRPCRARSTCSAAAAVDGARGEESDVVGVGTLPLQGNTWRTGHLKLSHMHSALARCAAMRRAAGGAFLLLFPCSLSPLSSLLSPLSSLLSPLLPGDPEAPARHSVGRCPASCLAAWHSGALRPGRPSPTLHRPRHCGTELQRGCAGKHAAGPASRHGCLQGRGVFPGGGVAAAPARAHARY